jgi:hypothetical protein
MPRLQRMAPSLAVGFVGLIFVAVGSGVSWRTVTYAMRTVTTVAHVTGDRSERESSGSVSRTVHYPILEFSDTKGYSHELRGVVGSSTAWRTGRRVTVRYDPENPDEAPMAGVWDLLPHLFLLLGLAAVILAVKLALSKDGP